MKQIFKTISFPKEISGTSQTEIIRLAFNDQNEDDLKIFNLIKDLSSSELRILLNGNTYTDIISKSSKTKRSINNYCVSELDKKINELYKSYGDKINIKNIFSKNLIYNNFNSLSGTFSNNKTQKIHRWYPYIEGYSCDFVEEILNKLPYKPKTIYDPFSGSGTTQIVASHFGIESYYTEINPFMKFVIETKVNSVADILNSKKDFLSEINSFISKIKSKKQNKIKVNEELKDFFKPKELETIHFIKKEINNSFKKKSAVKDLLNLALASISVSSSKMIRRSDLRYRRENEYKYYRSDVLNSFIEKVNDIANDINELKAQNKKIKKTSFYCDNAKDFPEDNKKFDLIITSPPYINGTNYFRNTKLELLILDLVKDIADIKQYRIKAITAGINNVTKDLEKPKKIKQLEKIIKDLNEKSYDKRIPTMVESYFSDMDIVFNNISKKIKNNGLFYFDIGDSQFAGVHIPAEEILIDIAEKYGLKLIDRKHLRERTSKNGMKLTQSLLLFKNTPNKKLKAKKLNKDSAKSLLTNNIAKFKEFEYKNYPYSKRNWGNQMHSLCSYQGKLKPSIAHYLIKLFTNTGMNVLDPLAGVGTIPFEACLQGRNGISNDLSKIAYTNSLAKIKQSDKKKVEKIISELENYIKNNNIDDKEINKYNFGFNKTLIDYYEKNTFKEILLARKFFLNKKMDQESALVFSSILHILHGNRPYALSRRSHPVVPFAPQGNFEYKNLIEKLKEKIERSIDKNISKNFCNGEAYNENFLDLTKKIRKDSVDAIITSPPFLESTKFYMSNWIRLWFAGWNKEDFENKKSDFLETKQKKDINIYDNFFKISKKLLKKDGIIIMHLGKTKNVDMGKELIPIAKKYFKVFDLVDETVEHVEKFGIKDQGATRIHQYLFLHN